ncbi:hypothetical protein BDR07DRAFT_481898 [Suillus spraguei]|nr:hypothetical protein BDR07DRAFT_481898 [Suillus spraguei]
MLVSSYQVVEIKLLLTMFCYQLIWAIAHSQVSIIAGTSDKASQLIRRACVTPTKRGGSDPSQLVIVLISTTNHDHSFLLVVRYRSFVCDVPFVLSASMSLSSPSFR